MFDIIVLGFIVFISGLLTGFTGVSSQEFLFLQY
jgi:hypothetical protein